MTKKIEFDKKKFKDFNDLKNFRCFQFSVLTYSDLCQFEKTERTDDLENLNLMGKQMTGVLFSSTKIDLAVLIALESLNLVRDFVRGKQ